MDGIVQGTAEWHALRCGRVTASRVADVIARTKTGYSASRANYAAELIAERLTGCTAPSFTNAAMQHGTEQEPFARQAYADLHGVEVEQVAFVIHPEIPMAGASPDGLVGDRGLVEIKCPSTASHLATLLGEPIAARYITQMQWQMSCTGRDWCDFCSFDPRLGEAFQLFVQRVPRDASMIVEMEDAVVSFLAEIDAKIARLNSLWAAA